MRGFAKVFCLEIASLVRSKTLVMLVVASVAWMFAMPYLVRGDGTADGSREMLVRYSLGGAFALLLVALLASATGSLARERAAKRLQLTMVRPVRHAAVAFEKAELVERLRDAWDVVISTGTNELLDLNGFAGAPIVQQFHTNPRSQFKRKRLLRNWKIRRALRRVAAIQVLQEAFVPQVAKYGPPVSVIGNWSGQTPPAVPCEAAAPVIIYPAAFAKAKNQDLLILYILRIHLSQSVEVHIIAIHVRIDNQ